MKSEGMSPETTPSSSGSDSSRPLISAEERLMVAVRIRPLRGDESQRVLHAVNKKVRSGGILLLFALLETELGDMTILLRCI